MGRSQAVTTMFQNLPNGHLGHSPVFSVDCVACVCHAQRDCIQNLLSLEPFLIAWQVWMAMLKRKDPHKNSVTLYGDSSSAEMCP